jgi:hypothetical protein
MRVKCRDALKIPKERLFYVDKKLFKISIMVELLGAEKNKVAMGLSDVGGDIGNGNKENEFDNANDLEDEEPKNLGGGGSKDSNNGGNAQQGQSSGSKEQHMLHRGIVQEGQLEGDLWNYRGL